MTNTDDIVLRDYQAECIEAIGSHESGNYLVQMATGLGKTVTFSRIPVRGRMLILSHRDELVRQPQKYFSGRSFGIEKSSVSSNGEDVVSASVQTLCHDRRLKRFSPDDFDVIVTDEAHHAVAPTYRKIFDYFNPRLHIGFTATPNRGDKVRLRDVYDDIIFMRSLLWGIDKGYLCDIRAERIELRWDPSAIKTRHGDFDQKLLDMQFNTHANNDAIAQAVISEATGPTIVFAINKNHACELSALIPGSAVLLGSTPAAERAEILKRYEAGEIQCIVNCMVLTEGADLPCTSTVVIARPTRSNALYAQMVGRGVRLYPGKEELLLIDCVGVTEDAELCCAPTLAGIDPLDKPDRTKCDEGLLSGMREAYMVANDTPEGWLLSARKVDVFKKMYCGIAWSTQYDGSYVLSLSSCTIRITPPDILGNSSAIVAKAKSQPELLVANQELETCFALAADYIYRNFSRDRSLWDAKRVAEWSSSPISDKQIAFVNDMASQLGMDIDDDWLDNCSKRDASVLIDNLKSKCDGLDLPTPKQISYATSLAADVFGYGVALKDGIGKAQVGGIINALLAYKKLDLNADGNRKVSFDFLTMLEEACCDIGAVTTYMDGLRALYRAVIDDSTDEEDLG